MRQKYDFARLSQYCKDNNVTLTTDYSDVALTGKTKITGKCIHEGCNELFCKIFTQLIKINAFCKEHTLIRRKEKSIQTCLEKYGTENVFQNEEIKEKIKETCIIKYGVSNSMQSSEVRKKTKATCLLRYGTENPLQNEDIKEKAKQTLLMRYGVSHNFKNEEIKNKFKETMQTRYGVENPSQIPEIKEKVKQTCLIRYGSHPLKNEEIKEKAKQTFIEKYGTDNPNKSEIIKEKIKQTCRQKYGVDHVSQDPTISEKQSKCAYKRKDYTFPSGKVIQVQGYEPFAIDQLMKNGTEECDIITGCKNVPEIWHEDETQKQHRHFVDIYIPSQHICIEVKSTWTAKKKYDSIFLKQEAAKKLGYKYEIWIYNGKGERVELHK